MMYYKEKKLMVADFREKPLKEFDDDKHLEKVNIRIWRESRQTLTIVPNTMTLAKAKKNYGHLKVVKVFLEEDKSLTIIVKSNEVELIA